VALPTETARTKAKKELRRRFEQERP
jgi:hypothetical protein